MSAIESKIRELKLKKADLCAAYQADPTHNPITRRKITAKSEIHEYFINACALMRANVKTPAVEAEEPTEEVLVRRPGDIPDDPPFHHKLVKDAPLPRLPTPVQQGMFKVLEARIDRLEKRTPSSR